MYSKKRPDTLNVYVQGWNQDIKKYQLKQSLLLQKLTCIKHSYILFTAAI